MCFAELQISQFFLFLLHNYSKLSSLPYRLGGIYHVLFDIMSFSIQLCYIRTL